MATKTDSYTGRPLSGWVPCDNCGTLALDPHINQHPCKNCGADPMEEDEYYPIEDMTDYAKYGNFEDGES